MLIQRIFIIILLFLINISVISGIWIMLQEDAEEDKNRILKSQGISPFRLTVLFICFLPVLADLADGKDPKVYKSGISAIVSEKDGSNAPVWEIVNGIVLTQTFVCRTDCVTDITLIGSTYRRENHGTLHIALMDDETNILLYEWNVASEDIGDNCPLTVIAEDPFKNFGLYGKTLRIELSSDDSFPGNAVTVQFLEQDVLPDGELKINERETGGDLILQVNGFIGPLNRSRTKLVLCLELAAAGQMVITLIKRRKII